MGEAQGLRPGLAKAVSVRALAFLVGLAALLFLPAGTLDYWQAWAYIAVLFIPFFAATAYLMQTDPALVERRMHTQEREQPQKWASLLMTAWFLLVFLIPGFDRRFGWSGVPAGIVLAADGLVFLGYVLIFAVLRENSYASRVVEVEQGQKVISGGPYSIVRHPMYLGTVVMFMLTPLALGSYWGLIPTPLILPLLAARILNEEQVLARELPGYAQYMQKVRFRMIPGIW